MCPLCYQRGGSLLHCPSTLTRLLWRFISVALSLESPPPDVIRHPALWSPDFPHLRSFDTCSRDYPVYLPLYNNLIYFLCQINFSSHDNSSAHHSQRCLQHFPAASQLTLLISVRFAHISKNKFVHAGMTHSFFRIWLNCYHTLKQLPPMNSRKTEFGLTPSAGIGRK